MQANTPCEFILADGAGHTFLMQGDAQEQSLAETQFREALYWAHRQGALSLELRAAASLARLLHHQDRSGDAAGLLQPVYDRFTEGLDTADLKAAAALLITRQSTLTHPSRCGGC